jgi:hypothetical protein
MSSGSAIATSQKLHSVKKISSEENEETRRERERDTEI